MIWLIMVPVLTLNNASIFLGDCRDVLAQLPSDSVHCCATSPPYWNLRDYGVEGQLGLEQTPEEFIGNMVSVFREVRRVLRPDGTLWLNLGDCYAGKPGGGQGKNGQRADRRFTACVPEKGGNGLKPKDLVGMPWRVAFSLQADGWWLRSDIVWSKPNCMPESVADRPTKSHEYIFLLTKSQRYFYDAEAIREADCGVPAGNGLAGRQGGSDRVGPQSGGNGTKTAWLPGVGRNKRSVWTVATAPYPGAHFATFPAELIEPCILAGTSAVGCCPLCGDPWQRVLERASVKPLDYAGKWSQTDPQSSGRRILANVRARRVAGGQHDNPFPAPRTVGWRQGCGCPSQKPVPCRVLDPFNGSGTTGLVALENRRGYLGIELKPDYIELTRKRLACIQPVLF